VAFNSNAFFDSSKSNLPIQLLETKTVYLLLASSFINSGYDNKGMITLVLANPLTQILL
jgi:hypothetical protein